MRGVSLLGILLVFVAACVGTGQPWAFAKAKASEDQVWMLRQNSDQYGVVNTIVGRDAMHMATADYAMGIRAPKFDLIMMNVDTKRYMERTGSEYDALGRRQLFSPELLKQVKTGKTEKVAGLNATHYTLQPKGSRVMMEWWSTNDLNTSEPLNTACAKFTGLSGISRTGFLLRYWHTNTAGRRYVYLDTIGAKRVDPSLLKFQIPANFKKVPTAMELIGPDEPDALDTSGLGGTMGDGKSRPGHK